ncbi:hypothetical protein DB42_CT00510 [Neochlamydia sp. EPS4]|nr:hypothetical protein DB42_CT00510 [Neochlamydia sp. EPS4]
MPSILYPGIGKKSKAVKSLCDKQNTKAYLSNPNRLPTFMESKKKKGSFL